jgi:DNA ligase-1
MKLRGDAEIATRKKVKGEDKPSVVLNKPMLSGKFKDVEADLKTLTFPLLATPKYDGIRALTIDIDTDKVTVKGLVSRTFKEIPNRHMFKTCSDLPLNLDGELVSGTFNETSGNVMRRSEEPDFEYHVFDYVKTSLATPYEQRMKDLEALALPDFCVKVLPVVLNSLEELEEYEAKCLGEGFEGIMLRSPEGAYKCGRGTQSKMDLMKVKRFKDAEAEITGFEELMKNDNAKEKDNFGRSKRSTSKENKHGLDSLGALHVKAVNGEFKGVEFKVGTGFDQALRKEIWEKRDKLKGQIIRYKYQSEGGEDRPRFPVFEGFRDKKDM